MLPVPVISSRMPMSKRPRRDHSALFRAKVAIDGRQGRAGFSALSHPVRAEFGGLAAACESAFGCLLFGIPWTNASSKT